MPDLRERAKRSKSLTVAAMVARDVRTGLQSRFGRDLTTNGATHVGMSIDESLAYIDVVYEDFIEYGKLSAEDLRGARILEIGPGDNFGLGLRLLAAGAREVVCADRFYSVRDHAQQRQIYGALLERMSDEERRVVDGVVDLSGTGDVAFDASRLKYEHGIAIEEADDVYEPASFDLILSRAVMEHVYDTDAAFRSMDRLLKPGGMMMHKVDLRDHLMFSGAGHNELTFLTVPDRVYRLMTVNSGRPNRRLFDYYRKAVDDLGYEADVLITHLVGEAGEVVPHRAELRPEDVGERQRQIVREIRPKLAPRYRNLADEDLMVSGVFVVARKPGSSSPHAG